MRKLEIHRHALLPAGVLLLLGTACFTPENFGEGVGEGVVAEGQGAAEHGEAETPEVEAPEADGTAVVEGIIPGTTGKKLEIELPEVTYDPPFDGKPLNSKKLDNGVIVEEFVLGDGAPVGDNTMIAFNFKGFATASGRQVMGSRGTPSKLLVNDAAREKDPIASAMLDGLEGMKPGGKRKVTLPSALVEADAPPGRPPVGDLIMTVELVEVTDAPELHGVEAYAGTPIASKKLDGGLEIYDYTAGEGRAAKTGDNVVTHYIGHLDDGTLFDTSHSRAEGMPLTAGGPGVITGFAEGVIGARKGMLRKVVIPPELGYGSADRGKIPPNSTLIFYLEIMEVNEGIAGPQTGVRIDPRGQAEPIEKKPKPKPKPADDDGAE